MAFAACQAIYSVFGGGDTGPVFPHAPHIEEGLECSSCHPGAETAASAGFPPTEKGCMLCHEEQDKEKPPERTVAAFLADGKPRWLARAASYGTGGDVRFDHAKHAAAGVACASCHTVETEAAKTGAAATEEAKTEAAAETEAAKTEAAPAPLGAAEGRQVAATHELRITGGKPACMACHARVHPKGTECSICHERTRKDARPDTHTPTWLRLHGQTSRTRIAGTGETTCAQCHQESSCIECHRVELPTSHNNFWRRRGHGLTAAIDRTSCSTCHEPDSCVRCHQETTPMSHRGGFGPPRNNHCLASCHLPPAGLGCGVCHKSFPSHVEGPRVPTNPAHVSARSPSDCLGCHVALSHPNSGGDCRFCHR